MGQITGVHGIGQQYLGRHQILDLWAPALADGLERAGCRVRRPDLDMAFYGWLFRPPAAVQSLAKSRPDDDPSAQLAELDAGELADLTAAVGEIVAPDDLAYAAANADKGLWLPVPVQTLVGAVERRFPLASGILCLGVLRQVRRYLRDPSLKAEIDRITAVAAEDATVLVGHSLGSVVAYEFLRLHPDHSVKLLVTLGSPLGLRMVRGRLPAGDIVIDRWENVRDENDPVTAAGVLGHWYPDARDNRVENGSDAHAADRYLNSSVVGNALLKALPELGR